MRTTILTTIAVLVVGVTALWAGTDGFSVITAEGARREAVTKDPRPLPPVLLRDQTGEAFRLQDYQGGIVLVEFIYTRCMTICNSLGLTFEVVGEALPKDVLGQSVHLLSISFDERDTTKDLSDYGERFGATPDTWRIARVENPRDIADLLTVFGVTVVPDVGGDFEHNAAVHLIDRKNKLVEIFDHTPPQKSLEAIWRRL